MKGPKTGQSLIAHTAGWTKRDPEEKGLKCTGTKGKIRVTLARSVCADFLASIPNSGQRVRLPPGVRSAAPTWHFSLLASGRQWEKELPCCTCCFSNSFSSKKHIFRWHILLPFIYLFTQMKPMPFVSLHQRNKWIACAYLRTILCI